MRANLFFPPNNSIPEKQDILQKEKSWKKGITVKVKRLYLQSGFKGLHFYMIKKYPILLFLLLLSLVMQAQQPNIDSLLQRLKVAKGDSATLNLYLEIGNQYEGTEPLQAKVYYRKAIDLSTKMNFHQGIIRSLIYYSSVFSVTGEYDSAIIYTTKALAIARETKDSLNTGIALLNIGVAHGFLEDYETAIQYCQEGLKMVDGKSHKNIEVQINDRLQVLYYQMAQYDKGVVFGKKAVQQSRELNIPYQLAQSLTNLAVNYQANSMHSKGIPLLAEALVIAKELGNYHLESAILLNLSDGLLVAGDYEKVKLHADRSLLLHRELGSLDGQAISLRALAMYYVQIKDFGNARKFATESSVIAKKMNLTLDYAEAIHVLSNVAFATGDMESGLKYYREYGDSIKAVVKHVLSDKSANLEKKYETEKKETQIKKLEAEKKVQQLSIRQKNILNSILIGGAAVLLIISLLLYRNHKNKQKLQQQRINELEKEKQLTATEAVLKGEEQERSRLAKDLHDGLGGMLSGIKYSLNTMKGNLIMTPDNTQAFERSMDMLDSSIKEMRRVAHNMMPEALVKFGLDTALKDFANDINQSGALQVNYQSIEIENAAIDQITAITVYRIIQELLHNIIKHAAARTAIVQVAKSDGHITITVEDDGKGFDTNILTQSKGIGWTNIQSRVDYLKGKLDIQSEHGKGTSVHIELAS
ncbi:MAG: sensor histidine kinase [Chitinophagaceae bacterium]